MMADLLICLPSLLLRMLYDSVAQLHVHVHACSYVESSHYTGRKRGSRPKAYYGLRL